MMNKTTAIMEYFDKILPNAKCELNYEHDYELLLAVMFSAQTTDKRVNEATENLFKKFPGLDLIAKADFLDVEKIIRPIGLSKTKANNAIKICQMLIDDFGSRVPSNKDDLMRLPGVGNKTANVVRAELFKLPEFAVDTHVLRISKRLGFIKSDGKVEEAEKALRNAFDQSNYIKLHHQFIHFGRYYCTAAKPICETCELKTYCVLKA